MKPPQPRRAHRDKGNIRNNVPEVRYAEQGALVGELVIALILRDRRQQQQSESDPTVRMPITTTGAVIVPEGPIRGAT